MGEIADAVLDGDMCERCGCWIGEGDGYPRLCSGCEGADKDDHLKPWPKPKKGKKK